MSYYQSFQCECGARCYPTYTGKVIECVCGRLFDNPNGEESEETEDEE